MRTVIFLLVIVTSVPGALGAGETQPGDNPLEWKCVWVWGSSRKDENDAIQEAALVKSLGFNTIVLSDTSPVYRKRLIEQGHRAGLKVYLGINAGYGEWGFQEEPGVTLPPVTCLQRYDNLETLNNPKNPDYAAHPGPWLCFDRPEVRQFVVDTARALATAYAPDGLALDFIGYKNYRGCQCRYSRQECAKFAAAHPVLSKDDVQKEFSLERMAAVYEDVRTAVHAINPQIKLACHTYPQFDLEPLYGNRLAVDYPAQTVAWFFKPHWPLADVAAHCQTVKANEHKYHAYVTGTGLIGVYLDEKCLKTPDRLRAEIRAFKTAGLRALCVAGDAAFMKDAGLARVVSEELGGTLPAAKQ